MYKTYKVGKWELRKNSICLNTHLVYIICGSSNYKEKFKLNNNNWLKIIFLVPRSSYNNIRILIIQCKIWVITTIIIDFEFHIGTYLRHVIPMNIVHLSMQNLFSSLSGFLFLQQKEFRIMLDVILYI